MIETRIGVGNKLKALVAAGAIALSGVSAAHAEKAPSKPAREISAKQHLRNEQAQKRVTWLAKLIMSGPAARKGGQQNYIDGSTGKPFGIGGVYVEADSSKSELPGRYTFNVTAPINENGQLKLKKATSVSITEGDTEHTYVSSTFGVDPADHNMVAFHGIYSYQGESFNNLIELDAYTDPAFAKAARLTPKRLDAAASQSAQIIFDAELRQPTGTLLAPFVQPPGTVVGMH